MSASASASKSESGPNAAWNALVKKYSSAGGAADDDDDDESELTDSAVWKRGLITWN